MDVWLPKYTKLNLLVTCYIFRYSRLLNRLSYFGGGIAVSMREEPLNKERMLVIKNLFNIDLKNVAYL